MPINAKKICACEDKNGGKCEKERGENVGWEKIGRR